MSYDPINILITTTLKGAGVKQLQKELSNINGYINKVQNKLGKYGGLFDDFYKQQIKSGENVRGYVEQDLGAQLAVDDAIKKTSKSITKGIKLRDAEIKQVSTLHNKYRRLAFPLMAIGAMMVKLGTTIKSFFVEAAKEYLDVTKYQNALGSAVIGLSAKFTLLKITLMEIVGPLIAPLIDGLINLVDGFLSLPPEIQNTIVVLGGLFTAAMLGAGSLFVLAGSLSLVKFLSGELELMELKDEVATLATKVWNLTTNWDLFAKALTGMDIATIKTKFSDLATAIKGLKAVDIKTWATTMGDKIYALGVTVAKTLGTKEGIAAAVSALKLKMAALGTTISTGLTPVLQFLMTPLGLLLILIAALALAWKYNWADIHAKTKNFTDRIRKLFEKFEPGVTKIITTLTEGVKTILKPFVTVIVGIFTTGLDLILTGVETFADLITGDFEGMMDHLTKFFARGWLTIMDIAREGINAVIKGLNLLPEFDLKLEVKSDKYNELHKWAYAVDDVAESVEGLTKANENLDTSKLSDALTGATGTVDLSAISGAGVGIPALSGEGVSGVNSCPSIINISIGDVIIDPAPGFEITDTETMRDAVIATFKDIGFGELVVSNNSVS